MAGNGLPFSDSEQGTEIVRILHRHVKKTGILAAGHAIVRNGGFIHVSGAVKLVVKEVREFFVRMCEGKIGIKISIRLLCARIIVNPCFQLCTDLLLRLLHLHIAAGVDLKRVAHGFDHLMYIGINVEGAFKSAAGLAAIMFCGVDKVGQAAAGLFHIGNAGRHGDAQKLLLPCRPEFIRDLDLCEVK